MSDDTREARGGWNYLAALLIALAVGVFVAGVGLSLGLYPFGFVLFSIEAGELLEALLVLSVTAAGTFVYLRLGSAQRELAGREEQYRTLAEASHDVVFVIDRNDKVRYVNSFAASMLGKEPSEVVGRRRSESFPMQTEERQRWNLEQVFQTGMPLYREDLTAFPEVDSWQGTWLVPLKDKAGRAYAVMGVGRDITERKRAEEALLASEKRLRQITGVLGEGLFVIDERGLFSFVNPEAQRLFGWGEGELLGRDSHKTVHRQEPGGTALRPGSCPIMRVLRDGKGLRTEDLVFTRKDGSTFPVSCVVEPLREDGKVVAAVVVFQDITERKRKESLDEAMDRVNEVVHSTLRVDEIMQRVLVQSAGAVGCDSAAIVLQQGPKWIVKHYWGPSPDLSGLEFAEGEVRMLTQAARKGEPVVFVRDAASDERVDRGLLERYEIGSFIMVPLRFPGRLLGALVLHKLSKNAFDDVDADFARSLAAAISLAIENARHFERQRGIAEALQSSLLAEISEVEGLKVGWVYQSASEAARVGGDFFDLFAVGERIYVVIGDVAGAGVSAAGRTEIVRSSVRCLALVDPSPAFIIGHVNEALLQRASEQFVTVSLLMLDRRGGTMTVCSAGHPPPLLVAEECSFVPVSQGLPLGVMPYEYEEGALDMAGAHTILLYTDGVTEARREGRFFGEDRLLDIARKLRGRDCDDMAKGVLRSVQEFTGGRLSDDLAVLCLRLRV
ncbi:MAG: PAS domain S-box protein [Actinobacteria bacterium]|nr:MAG: PAS domain S-box protein [Actinomycetota bacterium]